MNLNLKPASLNFYAYSLEPEPIILKFQKTNLKPNATVLLKSKEPANTGTNHCVSQHIWKAFPGSQYQKPEF